MAALERPPRRGGRLKAEELRQLDALREKPIGERAVRWPAIEAYLRRHE
jgi:hypothetical protein